MTKPKFMAAAAVYAIIFLSASIECAQSANLIPFDQFYRSLSQASFADQAHDPASHVESATAFEAMRQHILSLYEGVSVKHSFMIQSSVVDCVPILQQPGVRAQGITSLAEPPPHSAGSEEASCATVSGTQTNGSCKATVCEAGTIPMKRVTLDDVTRFKNLQEFSQKGP